MWFLIFLVSGDELLILSLVAVPFLAYAVVLGSASERLMVASDVLTSSASARQSSDHAVPPDQTVIGRSPEQERRLRMD